jgi:hypothetical protein
MTGYLLQLRKKNANKSKLCDHLGFLKGAGTLDVAVVTPLKCSNSHLPPGVWYLRTPRLSIGTSDVQDQVHWIHDKSSLYKLLAQVSRYAFAAGYIVHRYALL